MNRLGAAFGVILSTGLASGVRVTAHAISTIETIIRPSSEKTIQSRFAFPPLSLPNLQIDLRFLG